MKLPDMEVFQYGYFDSLVKFSDISVSKDRHVNAYEIEFYAESFPKRSFINGVTYPIQSCQILIARPGDVRHSELPFACYCLHLRTENKEIRSLLDGLPRVFVTVLSQDYLNLFQEFLRVDDLEMPTKELTVQAVTFRILSLLSMENPQMGTEAYLHKNQKILLSARNFIDNHFADAISLSDIAEHVHLSPNYLHRLFTDFFHKTPGKYLEEKRISDAKFRLITTDDSVSQIASLSGFASQSYFTTKFTRVTNFTPLAYRREMRTHGTL